jgi:predicted acetyltransferase
MMGGLHADARARGEIAAVLTASESTIYGRFGYGPATWRLGCSIDRVDGRFARPVGDPGRVRIVERGEADAIYQQVYEDARRACAGAVSRPDFWWPEVFWVTEPGRALFEAVHEDADGHPDGYVSYEIRGEWPGGADHRRQLWVWDLQAVDARTRAALWEFVLNVDLVVTVTATNLPPDEPLRFLLADSRKLRTNYLIDSVWVLPLDAAALLSARTYSASGKLVIEIVDPGSRTRVALDGGPEGAHGVEQQSAVPDVSCSRATLGALSLGGTSWATLAAAGAVDEHTPGALALADAMFATSPAPATMSWF